MQINALFEYLNHLYPIANQDDWDKCGMISFNQEAKVKNIGLALDFNLANIEFAIANNINVLITHHPLYIDENDLKKSHIKKILFLLEKHQISVISLHTCFDKARFGMNYAILKRIDCLDIKPLVQSDYLFSGKLKWDKTKDLNFFLENIKKKLELDWLHYLIPKEFSFKYKKYLNIAVVGGSGGFDYESIYKKDKIDFFITAEIKWHMWSLVESKKIGIIETSHAIENVFVYSIEKALKKINLNGVKLAPLKVNIY